MIDPVKQFDAAMQEIGGHLTNVRTYANRAYEYASTAKQHAQRASDHVAALHEAAEAMKEMQGLKPSVATELLKSFVTMIQQAEELSGLSLQVPEIVPEGIKATVGDPVPAGA